MNEAPHARVFVGAALPLIAFPIAVAAYAVFVSDDHRLDRTITVVWQDNQLALSVLAAVGLLATLGSSLLLFSGLQRSSAAMFGVIPLAALVSLSGVGAATWTVRANLVSPRGPVVPADLPFFVMAVTREGLTLLAAGLSVSLAILVASGLAQAALGNRQGLAGALVCFSGAGASVVAVHRLVAITDSIGRAVHSTSGLWLEELVHETTALGPSRVPVAALLVLLSVGVGIWIARRQVGLALPLVVLGIGAAIPAASLGLTLALVSTASLQLVPHSIPQHSLMTLHGALADEPLWVLTPTGISTRDERHDFRFVEEQLITFRDLYPGHDGSMQLGLGAGSRTADLVWVLETSRRTGFVRIHLVGQSDVNLATAAPELRPLLQQFSPSFRQVNLELVEEEGAAFILMNTTDLDALLRAAESSRTRDEPLRVAVRP